MLAGNREICAGGQADQIQRVWSGPRFVQIIHAPDEPAFLVAPGAEIFDVQIADRQHPGRANHVHTICVPQLQPAVKRGAKKGERRLRHVLVF